MTEASKQVIERETRTDSRAQILEGVSIGEECHISEFALIGKDVVIGNKVIVRPGAYLPPGVVVEDNVFIGANATFAEDTGRPESASAPKCRTVVKRNASIGANVTVLDGITIGQGAVVLAGSVVTRNVPSLAIVSGNPAVITGYEGARIASPHELSSPPAKVGIRSTQVEGVNIHRLPSAADMRGDLTFAEVERHIPFEIKRFFLVYGVPNMEVRGEHAHRNLHQFIICVHGQCSLMVDNGKDREEILLDSPTIGVHLPPLVWGVQYKHTPEAVQLVLASDFYDPKDYIRDYAEFLSVLRQSPHL